MKSSCRNRRPNQQGSILVCVIVCLSVATMLIAAVTHSALKNRRQIRTERQLRQVELLVEAGAQRALEKLASDDDYTGEDWRLTSEALPGYDAALVEIKVTPSDESSSRTIHLAATLPADSTRPIRRSDTFYYSLPNSKPPSPINEE